MGGGPHLLLPICAVLLALMALAIVASAQTNPPASGDWIINDDTTITNRAVLVRGSVNVNGGGRLTLDNVALTIQPTYDGSNGLTVNSNGRLTMSGGSYGSANAMRVKFTVNTGATVAMEKVVFHEPVYVGDLVSFYGELVRLGRTSITVRVNPGRRFIQARKNRQAKQQAGQQAGAE